MDRVCPLLGLETDRRSAMDGPDLAHRCHAEIPPLGIDRPIQSRLCLTEAHPRCDRYLAYVARHDGHRPGRSAIADGLVSTRLLLAPEPTWRGFAGRARGARSSSVAVVVAGVAVVGIGGAVLGAALLDEAVPATGPIADATPDPTTPVASPRTATPRASPSAVPSAQPSPTPTATPSAAPTPVPTVAPTAAPPTAAPVPPRTYTVQQGDTLASIAASFATTAAAIQAANGIEDPDEILVGQVLVIP